MWNKILSYDASFLRLSSLKIDQYTYNLTKYRLNLDGGYYICKNKSKL